MSSQGGLWRSPTAVTRVLRAAQECRRTVSPDVSLVDRGSLRISSFGDDQWCQSPARRYRALRAQFARPGALAFGSARPPRAVNRASRRYVLLRACVRSSVVGSHDGPAAHKLRFTQ